MAYTRSKYKSPWCIEYEYAYIGDHGANDQGKAKKREITKEEKREENRKQKEKRIRRTIQLNFSPGDLWYTLKYPAGTRKEIAKVKEDTARFTRIMRSEYKRADKIFKYILKIEIGKKGGIHVHIIMPSLPEALTIVDNAWARARKTTQLHDYLDGMTHPVVIHEDGNAELLANYLAKDVPEEQKENLEEDEIKELSSYSTSRNLKRPEPERTKYVRRTMQKIIELGAEGINTPAGDKYRTPGYIVDKSTWHTGINPITGLTYLSYTEIPIRRRT